jgi:hypothetical protein
MPAPALEHRALAFESLHELAEVAHTVNPFPWISQVSVWRARVAAT